MPEQDIAVQQFLALAASPPPTQTPPAISAGRRCFTQFNDWSVCISSQLLKLDLLVAGRRASASFDLSQDYGGPCFHCSPMPRNNRKVEMQT